MAKRVKLLTGFEVDLDGDLMAIIEGIYQEVVVRRELKHTYHDMKNEIENVVSQMDDSEARSYLVESLFLNTVTFENQMLDALLQDLASGEENLEE
jgi:hypothetical protein